MNSAVINLLKPPGMTSHDAVSFVRRVYGQKRVGHSGTLDPAAAGILPIYLGQATRLAEYADEFDKTYRAEIIFGMDTDTGDDTGTVLHTQTVRPGDLDLLPEIVLSFLGGYDQVPPMYSALKVNGRKLYELAREGMEIERTARRIDINSISLLWSSGHKAGIEVTCSKGTYIRTLCVDIGSKIGVPATMGFLLRIRVGPFDLNTAHTIEEITDNPQEMLLSADIAVQHLPLCLVDETEARLLQQGRAVVCRNDSLRQKTNSRVRLHTDRYGFFGVARLDVATGMLQPAKIFMDGIDNYVDH